MATLKIVIKGEFFDEIKSGVKKIEYREITAFWTSRLYTSEGKKRNYDSIEFINGYNKDARRLVTEYGGVLKKKGLYHIAVGKKIRGKTKQNKKTDKANLAAVNTKSVDEPSGTYYIQYHNADALGRFPFTKKTGLTVVKPDHSFRGPFSIFTSKKGIVKAQGSTCFLILGINANPKQYYLWTCFSIDRVTIENGWYIAAGKGFNLRDSVLLNDVPDFKDFKKFCENFGIGFQSINNHQFHKQLKKLAAMHK